MVNVCRSSSIAFHRSRMLRRSGRRFADKNMRQISFKPVRLFNAEPIASFHVGRMC
jgi:hypothetical protein